jgi:23S rRNA (guanine745-N1)-methyltransferase
MPQATWIVANADRILPVSPASVDVALSLFGRRPALELARVVRPAGKLVVALPGEDDLVEIREAALGPAVGHERVRPAIAELAAAGFEPVLTESWRRLVLHDRAAVEDALAMSYRGARRAERARLEARLGPEQGIEVTLDVDVVAFLRVVR